MFAALADAMIVEAACGQVDMSLISVDSTVARTQHDAASMQVDEDVLTVLGEAPGLTKGDPEKHKTNMTPLLGWAPPDRPQAPGATECGDPRLLAQRLDLRSPSGEQPAPPLLRPRSPRDRSPTARSFVSILRKIGVQAHLA